MVNIERPLPMGHVGPPFVGPRREATCECCRRNDAPQGERLCESCASHQRGAVRALRDIRDGAEACGAGWAAVVAGDALHGLDQTGGR